jgi:hypothetical protein
MNSGAAVAFLEDLAGWALRSEFEPVACLEAPEVPRRLLRADGRNVYQRHGGVRYATRAQLAMEERILTQASADNAPRLTRAGRARARRGPRAARGCAGWPRAERARAAHADRAARGSGRRGAVGADRWQARVGDQRAGWLRQDLGAGRAWAAAGPGQLVGITASQSARNTLAAGVPVSYNAQFLDHLPGRRGARGPVEAG